MMLQIIIGVYLTINAIMVGYFLALEWEPEYLRGQRSIAGIIIQATITILLGCIAVILGWLFIFIRWLLRSKRNRAQQ